MNARFGKADTLAIDVEVPVGDRRQRSNTGLDEVLGDLFVERSLIVNAEVSVLLNGLQRYADVWWNGLFVFQILDDLVKFDFIDGFVTLQVFANEYALADRFGRLASFEESRIERSCSQDLYLSVLGPDSPDHPHEVVGMSGRIPPRHRVNCIAFRLGEKL